MEYEHRDAVRDGDGAGYGVAIDTGGTFTDVAVRRPRGDVFVWKVPSRPERPNEAVSQGLTEALDLVQASPPEVAQFSHGTTVATNTVLTRSGARVGLVTTKGFRDVLRIGHQARPSIYDSTARRPGALVARAHTWEVPERIDADGTVLQPLPERAVLELAGEIRAAGCDAVVVSFLNAYADTSHERRCAALLSQAGAAQQVFAATSVSAEMREYERTSTAVLNAYVAPAITSYLGELEHDLAASRLGSRLWIMQSNGGLIGARAASEQSVRTILSGLAGGVTGAAQWASQLDLPRTVSLDIGGTSTDIALIRDGVPDTMTDSQIEGYDLHMPAVDVHTIGAGGGSLAWLDSGGGLRVGPRSAGADPGPVCYGRGGTTLTVTDAHLLLGRLGTALLDGQMALDEPAARTALDRFAADLGIEPDEAAAGIIRVVNAAMARGVRKVSVERGIDIRDCVLTAFGGAGPLHAADLVRELGMKGAVIPPHPGIASAVGMLDAPLRHDFASNLATPRGGTDDGRPEDPARAAAAFEWLAREASEFMQDEESVPPETVVVEQWVDARYVGQSYELSIPWNAGQDVRARFNTAHAERYGYADRDAEMELVTARATVTVPLTGTARPSELAPGKAPTPSTRRQMRSDGEWWLTSVYRRDQLPADAVVHGPLIIEQLDSTIVVLSGQLCYHDESGFLHIHESEST
jgi:N-methylhydantoinase A